MSYMNGMSNYSTSRDHYFSSRQAELRQKLPSVTSTVSRRIAVAPAVPSRPTIMPLSSGLGIATAEFRDLKIHTSVTPPNNGVSSYGSSPMSDISVPRRTVVPTQLQMLQPSYNSVERPSQSDRSTYGRSYGDDSSFEPQQQRSSRQWTSRGFCGLRNLGNTCFMNSVIQCLSNTKLLLEYILSLEYKKDLNTTTSTCKGALISAFAELLTNMWDGVSTCVSPSTFKSAVQQFAPRFSGYNQQDSQELLRYLLQGLQEDVNRVRQRAKVKPLDEKALEKLPPDDRADAYWQHYHLFEESKIVDIFVGQLKSTLKCQVCGYESIAFDPFWDLSLPISKGYNTKTDLVHCIAGFMKEELLDGQEKARCDRCQKLQPCKKRFSIHRFPSILVLHLKRFSQGAYGTKLTTLVDFPVTNLNLTQFCDSPNISSQMPTYDLYAISNHSGSMYSGHYTAFARHPYDLRWYEYNDSRVTSISSRSLVTPEAYVLFYEQTTPLTY